MHFFRDCRRRLRAPTFGSSALESSCMSYTLRFSARWLLGLRPRPAGQPSAVVSAALRLLALIARMACMLFLQEQKTVTKKSQFLKAPLNLIEGY